MTQDRIAQKFKQIEAEDRTGIILFLTAGFPDLDATMELVPALASAGADCIELGVPFSDPLADGLTIQASSYHALQNGVTLESCLKAVRELRAKVPQTPWSCSDTIIRSSATGWPVSEKLPWRQGWTA